MAVKAYGTYAADKPLEPMEITRRAPGPHDVAIEIAYCGIWVLLQLFAASRVR